MPYYTTAKAGQPYKNKGGTILNAGNVSTVTNEQNKAATTNLSIGSSAKRYGYGSVPFLAVSPTSSGNVGTIKPISGGVFAQMEKGKYVAMVIGTRIAQQNNTVLAFGANYSVGKKNGFINSFTRDRVMNLLSVDYFTGRTTKGGNTGSGVVFNADHAVDQTTDALPGELQYMVGSPIPTQDNYKARTSN